LARVDAHFLLIQVKYTEGKDFLAVRDAKLGQVPYAGEYEFNHPGAALHLTDHSRIRYGDRLRVSWFHPVLIHGSQMACCLAEPKVYELLLDQAQRVNQLFEPKFFFMSHDEIRVAGWCRACRARKPGDLLADNVGRCVEILKRVNPKAQVIVWSDMFDPNHNAVDHFYLVNGTWEGSWKGLPPDVIIANWSNGREVLTLAEQGGFDLLLLDVHMPELDGFQVVQAVRERELTAGGHLPIIALTARSRKEDRERCLAAGMDDFQTKPIRPADLLAAIDRALRTHSSRPSRRLDLLDAPVLLAACGGDPTLLRKMCQTLTARVPEHLAALQDALRDQDASRLREAAHKCCGMLSEFSTVAGDLAGSLEELAADTQLDKAAPILEQLETIAHELVKQIDGITIEALRRQAEGVDENSGTAGP
jgi:CheY-like chemotaxis protein/HPt (histidine-containing phosphotransfer) domain-containing protein